MKKNGFKNSFFFLVARPFLVAGPQFFFFFLRLPLGIYEHVLFVVLLLTGIAFSQQKIGIVFSEKIRLDFEEFKDVEQQLQLELEVIQKEYQTLATHQYLYHEYLYNPS